jgi:polyphosphate:AMP phosphotransferase
MGRLDSARRAEKIPKKEFEARVGELRPELLNAQFDLGQRGDFSVLILLGGDDRIGRNEVYDRLHEWLDARHLACEVFDPPTEEERERPLFWRYWRGLPPRGQIGVFFNAWAMTGLGEHLLGELDAAGFEQRLRHVHDLEQTLSDDGTLILKLWIHLPKKGHKKRAKRKQRDEDWRISDIDREIYEIYDEAAPAIELIFERTDDARAPWIVVDGSEERDRDLTVAQLLLDALRSRLEAPPVPQAAVRAEVSSSRGALDEVDLSARLDREEYRERLDELQAEARKLTSKARRKGLSTALVFEGWDAAGKGGAIRRITAAMDARDFHVVPIAAPTDEERARHYLWRFWRHLPRAGRTVIFDRSWYGRVLVERVEGFAREDEWRRAYSEINEFESQFVEHGMLVRKFWLHIDPDEQMHRFREREKTAYKKYKLTDEDYRNRERWDDYVAAVNEMVARTSTAAAPWILVSANDKRWARVRVLEELCSGLKQML